MLVEYDEVTVGGCLLNKGRWQARSRKRKKKNNSFLFKLKTFDNTMSTYRS